MRRFWLGYFVAVALYMAGSVAMAFGPAVEARFWPVRLDQSVHHVERLADRLCWNWAGVKVRPLASDDLDVYVHVDRFPDRLVSAVYNAATGMPWRASAAPPPGPSDVRYCTTLPPHILPSDQVRVEWRAWYPGWLGLWRFSVDMPEVVSPGLAP